MSAPTTDLNDAARWITEHLGYPIDFSCDIDCPAGLWEAIVDHIHADRDGRWHGNTLTREETDGWLAGECGRQQ